VLRIDINMQNRIGLRGKKPFFRLAALALFLMPAAPAYAIPSYARQTGAECSACHTVYPQLTAFGRQFKMSGYTDGDSDLALHKKISAWLQASFTHTAKDQTADAAPGFSDNDNFALDQASLFFGGRIVDHVGAFVQGTYDGIGKEWVWDNVDIRFANRGTLAGEELIYGVTVNNNPTVTDPWNTTPVWGFPFDGSELAPSPAAAPLIRDGLGQLVLGTSLYADWRGSIYAEAGLYHTISRAAMDFLAGSDEDAPRSDGLAPYWRLALHRDDASQSLMVGTFGLHADLYPGGDASGGSDSYTDVGADGQYQYFWDRDSITVRASLIHEIQDLGGSFTLGDADSASGSLNSFDSSVSYLYDKTYQASLGIGHLWGGADAALYGTPNGSPKSTNFTLQFDWLPFNKNPWPVSVTFNPRLSLQYTHHAEFDGSAHNTDGSGRAASDNDTLFLQFTGTM